MNFNACILYFEKKLTFFSLNDRVWKGDESFSGVSSFEFFAVYVSSKLNKSVIEAKTVSEFPSNDA